MPIVVSHGDIGAALRAAEVAGKGKARRLNLSAGLSIHDRILKGRQLKREAEADEARERAQEIQASLGAARLAATVRRDQEAAARGVAAGLETARHHRATEQAKVIDQGIRERKVAFTEAEADRRASTTARRLSQYDRDHEFRRLHKENPGLYNYPKDPDYIHATSEERRLSGLIARYEKQKIALKKEIQEYGKGTGQYFVSDEPEDERLGRLITRYEAELEKVLDTKDNIRISRKSAPAKTVAGQKAVTTKPSKGSKAKVKRPSNKPSKYQIAWENGSEPAMALPPDPKDLEIGGAYRRPAGGTVFWNGKSFNAYVTRQRK